MSFWKITSENKPERVSTTKLKNEQILEKHLEDWIESSTDILGEPLLIIGRQIIIPEVKDRLDLLALDPNGNAVIIELKRGKMSAPIDMQALRYASYISKWEYQDFERHAKEYIGDNYDDFNFNEFFESFCSNAGNDDVPDINGNQRIIIVGSEVKDKLGSVALWLYERNIDIKVIEIDSYKEGDNLLIQPRTIIPHAVNKFSEIGKSVKGDQSKPWASSGKTWHLEKRMNVNMKEMFFKLDSLIQEKLNVDGPNYNQKVYISYHLGNYNWLIVKTRASVLTLQFTVKANTFDKVALASKLNIEVFDRDDSQTEKLNLPSSINILSYNSNSDRILLRMKKDFNLNNPAFVEFLQDTIKHTAKPN